MHVNSNIYNTYKNKFPQTSRFIDQQFAYAHNRIFKLQFTSVDKVSNVLVNIQNLFGPEHSNEYSLALAILFIERE
jgi:hypothetical protein